MHKNIRSTYIYKHINHTIVFNPNVWRTKPSINRFKQTKYSKLYSKPNVVTYLYTILTHSLDRTYEYSSFFQP